MCHIGRYYEAYYIEISDKGDEKVLSHHTVPYFIPIMSYYESYQAGKIHVRIYRPPNNINHSKSYNVELMEVQSFAANVIMNFFLV